MSLKDYEIYGTVTYLSVIADNGELADEVGLDNDVDVLAFINEDVSRIYTLPKSEVRDVFEEYLKSNTISTTEETIFVDECIPAIMEIFMDKYRSKADAINNYFGSEKSIVEYLWGLASSK